MPRARWGAVGGLGIAAILALTGCTATAMPTPTPTPSKTVAPSGDGVLRIGTLFPTTGSQASYGSGQVAAVNAAVREINAAGGVDGVPVEVVNRSTGDAGSGAAETAFAQLVEHGVDVVIGPTFSADALAVLPLAAEAGIPLIATGADDPAITDADPDGYLFRTFPSYAHQGAVLGELIAADGADTVVLVAGDDAQSTSLADPLAAALADAGAELVETVTLADVTDASSVARAVRTADPDAVVLATPDGGEATVAVLLELADDGNAGDTLWLTTRNLVDYSTSVPAGTLDGIRAVFDGVRIDAEATARMKFEDPGLRHTRYVAEAYDATVLAALTAVIAGDDGGPSIAWRLREASHGGIPCTSYGACLDVLETEPAISYAGLAGPLDLDAAGDPSWARYTLYRYAADGTFAAENPVEG